MARKQTFKEICLGPTSALWGFVVGFLTATIVLGITLYYSGEYIEIMSLLDSR